MLLIGDCYLKCTLISPTSPIPKMRQTEEVPWNKLIFILANWWTTYCTLSISNPFYQIDISCDLCPIKSCYQNRQSWNSTEWHHNGKSCLLFSTAFLTHEQHQESFELTKTMACAKGPLWIWPTVGSVTGASQLSCLSRWTHGLWEG